MEKFQWLREPFIIFILCTLIIRVRFVEHNTAIMLEILALPNIISCKRWV